MLSISLDLQELIRLLRTFGNKTANSLFYPREKSGRLRRLARKFAFENDKNERAWAEEIFGETEHSASYVWHRALLRRELLDRLFLLSIKTGSEQRKAMYRSHKSVFMVRVLLMMGARRTAMSLIPSALKRAKEFEQTADRIALLEALCSNASLNGNRKKFKEYDAELRMALELRVAEYETGSLLQQIDVESVGRARPSAKAKRLAATAPRYARALFRDHQTYMVGLSYYRIMVSSAEISEKTEKGMLQCERAQTFLSGFSKLYSKGVQGEFELHRLSLSVASRAYQKAAEAAKNCVQFLPIGSNNWFIAQEYTFQLFMHTNQFPAAAALYKTIVHHERFPSQPEQVREKWTLLGNYVSLALAHEGIAPPTKLNLDKVLTEIPIYKQDKVGYNASLHILQYLILAQQDQRDQLIQKSEAIAKYINRYFRGLHDRPLYGFLMTLTILNRLDFDIEKTQKQAKRYIEQFERFGHEKVDETQTLRFDTMWKWIVEWENAGSPKKREI